MTYPPTSGQGQDDEWTQLPSNQVSPDAPTQHRPIDQGQGPFGQSPQGPNPYGGDPYSGGQYGGDPYSGGQYGGGQYGQNPYAPNPYGQSQPGPDPYGSPQAGTPYVAPGSQGYPNPDPYAQPYGQAPNAYGPGYGAGYPPAYGIPLKVPTNGKAIAALVCGIGSLALLVFCALLSIPAGIAGLALGFVSKREVSESGGAQTGGGMALAGMITGGIGLLLSVLFVAFFGVALVASA